MASLAAAVLALAAGPSIALGRVATPETWGGALHARERLTGNWGGSRDTLAARGVVVNLDLQLTPQGVMSGGRDEGLTGWGNAIYTLDVDTGKAGWWPGGFISVRGESSFGNPGYDEVGSVVPANTSALLPDLLEPGSGLESATVTQFLGPRFGLTAGKHFALDFTKTAFWGDYNTQFMNAALSLPMVTALVPLSAFGGGAVFMPSERVSVIALALDPRGSIISNDIGDAFDDGVMFVGGLSVKTGFFGRAGHHALTGVWSNDTYLSLDQDPSNIARMLLAQRYSRLGDPGPLLGRMLERRFPRLRAPVQPLAEENETWTVSYGFDQYLWQPAGDAARGIGVFFNVGASDGNPNPVDYSLVLGLGGKGVLPGRPRDSFGIGWARTGLSDDLVPFLRERLNLGLEHEDAVELYYNLALTPWLGVTPSIQIVDSGFERTLGERGDIVEQDTAAVFFLRTFIRF